MGSSWIWLIFLGFMFYFFFRARNMGGGGSAGILSIGKSRGRFLSEDEINTTFADVAGVDEAKEELQEVVSFLREPERYTRVGAKIPRGVLLVGPPGTGKTLLAKAVAGESKVPFLALSGSEFNEMLVGVGASRVRDLFSRARNQAPCILFIDELDALGRARGAGTVNDDREQTLNQLLVEMDGFEGNEAVIIMGATNRPEILDQALLRPGRFDRHIAVTPPDKVGRKQILEIHARNVPLGPDADLTEIAARTPGFAGADLANLVNEAALLTARRDKDHVGAREFSDAIDRVVAGLEKKNRLLNEEDKRRVAYHEVGHALAGVLVQDESTIHKVSIVPRGLGALGFTMTVPTEEHMLQTKSSITAKLVGLLGGRAAEEVIFGEPSTGAQNDLQRATELARAMVVDYGMSDRVGPITIHSARKPIFLGDNPTSLGREVGEQLADTIDEEIRRIVQSAHETAVDVLTTHRDLLDAMSQRLLEVEVLEGEELQNWLNKAKKKSVPPPDITK